MANIKSKSKNIKRIARNNEKNRAFKSALKTATRKAKEAAVAKEKNITLLVSTAHKAIDKAVSKGVIHKNTGARKKSRLDAFIAKAAK